MPPHLQKLHDAIEKAGTGPKEMSQVDAKKIYDEIVAYDAAHEKFVRAIGTLSNNQQIQSHLHEAIDLVIKATTPTTPHVKK